MASVCFLAVVLLCLAECQCKSRHFFHPPRHHQQRSHNRFHQLPCQNTKKNLFDCTGQQLDVHTASLAKWNCDFEHSDCGIGNQQNMDSYFVWRSHKKNQIFGKTGVMFLDISHANSSGARLITSYFPTNGCRSACLTVEYLMCGNGPRTICLIQQDTKNRCVWQGKNRPEDQQYIRWANASVDVDLTDGPPRFFIEARFVGSPKKFGFFAIANLHFTYGRCPSREERQGGCDVDWEEEEELEGESDGIEEEQSI